jgi:hypothetical protein
MDTEPRHAGYRGYHHSGETACDGSRSIPQAA